MRSLVIAFLIWQCFLHRVVSCTQTESATPPTGTTHSTIDDGSTIAHVGRKDPGIVTDKDSVAKISRSEIAVGQRPVVDTSLGGPTKERATPANDSKKSATRYNQYQERIWANDGDDSGSNFELPASAKPCRDSRDCYSSLNERCIVTDSGSVCGCGRDHERNPRTKACEPPGKISIQDSARGAGDVDAARKRKERERWLLEELRKIREETPQLQEELSDAESQNHQEENDQDLSESQLSHWPSSESAVTTDVTNETQTTGPALPASSSAVASSAGYPETPIHEGTKTPTVISSGSLDQAQDEPFTSLKVGLRDSPTPSLPVPTPLDERPQDEPNTSDEESSVAPILEEPTALAIGSPSALAPANRAAGLGSSAMCFPENSTIAAQPEGASIPESLGYSTEQTGPEESTASTQESSESSIPEEQQRYEDLSDATNAMSDDPLDAPVDVSTQREASLQDEVSTPPCEITRGASEQSQQEGSAASREDSSTSSISGKPMFEYSGTMETMKRPAEVSPRTSKSGAAVMYVMDSSRSSIRAAQLGAAEDESLTESESSDSEYSMRSDISDMQDPE